MKNRLLAQAILPDITAEVRSYQCDKLEELVHSAPAVRLCQRLFPMGRTKLQWRPTEGGVFRALGRLCLLPADRQLVVRTTGGTMTAVICTFAPERFQQLIKVDCWADEMIPTLLQLRSPLIENLLSRLAREIMLPYAREKRVLDAIASLLTSELADIAGRLSNSSGLLSKLSPSQIDHLRTVAAEGRNGRSLAVAQLAKSWSVSPQTALRQFKETTGETIDACARRARFNRAAALLAEEGTPLKDVATELGFKTPSHFAAEFRKWGRCSPSEYRARCHAEVQASFAKAKACVQDAS